MTFLSNKARSDYYTNFITENSTDQRRLFRASKSLLNLLKGSGLPSSTNDYQLANDFGQFFAQKIADIRSDIRSASTKQICLPVNATSTVTASCFSEFNLLSESEVCDLITASSKTSCLLDPIFQPSFLMSASMCYCLLSARAGAVHGLSKPRITLECIYMNTFMSKVSCGQDKHSPKPLGQDKPRLELAADRAVREL